MPEKLCNKPLSNLKGGSLAPKVGKMKKVFKKVFKNAKLVSFCVFTFAVTELKKDSQSNYVLQKTFSGFDKSQL